MRYLIATLLLTWPLAAAAEPRAIADCEKVKGDLAYNQCLASFGPPARAGAGPGRANGGESPVQEEPPAPAPQRAGSLRRGRGAEDRRQAEVSGRRRGGRQSASFDIVGPRAERVASQRSRSYGRRRR